MYRMKSMWLQVVSQPQGCLSCGNGLSRALAVASGYDWLQNIFLRQLRPMHCTVSISSR